MGQQLLHFRAVRSMLRGLCGHSGPRKSGLQIVEEPVLRIVDRRRPVLDIVEPEGKFVPNDTDCGSGWCKSSPLPLGEGPGVRAVCASGQAMDKSRRQPPSP